MPKYRFSMFKAHSDVSSSCFMEGDADEEAREIADALLAQTDFEIAEVWRNAVMIYRVDKANPSSHK